MCLNVAGLRVAFLLCTEADPPPPPPDHSVLGSCGRVTRSQQLKFPLRKVRAVRGFFLEVWDRSEHSTACFIVFGQGFCHTNFYLTGSPKFFCLPLLTKNDVMSETNSDPDFYLQGVCSAGDTVVYLLFTKTNYLYFDCLYPAHRILGNTRSFARKVLIV